MVDAVLLGTCIVVAGALIVATQARLGIPMTKRRQIEKGGCLMTTTLESDQLSPKLKHPRKGEYCTGSSASDSPRQQSGTP
jgi:hypothetical protein